MQVWGIIMNMSAHSIVSLSKILVRALMMKLRRDHLRRRLNRCRHLSVRNWLHTLADHILILAYKLLLRNLFLLRIWGLSKPSKVPKHLALVILIIGRAVLYVRDRLHRMKLFNWS